MMAGVRYIEKSYNPRKERLRKEGIGLVKEDNVQDRRINVQ